MFLNALVGCALAIVLLSVVDEGRNFRKSKKQRALWSLVWRGMLVVIAVLMPNLVTWEERLFRRGIERRTSLGRVAWAIAFGLFHLVAGLPLFAALALSLLGLYC